jgi:hypothetical protein
MGGRKVLSASQRRRVVRAKTLLGLRQCLLVNRNSFRYAPGCLISRRKVVPCRNCAGMIDSQRFLFGFERLFCERYGLISATKAVIRNSQFTDKMAFRSGLARMLASICS